MDLRSLKKARYENQSYESSYTQYDEAILNKKSKVRPMTPTAWKAIPQGSVISIVSNPNCSGIDLWKFKKQFFRGVKKFTSWYWHILIDFLLIWVVGDQNRWSFVLTKIIDPIEDQWDHIWGLEGDNFQVLEIFAF